MLPTLYYALLLAVIVTVLVRRRSSRRATPGIPCRGHWRRDDLRQVVHDEYLQNPDRAYAIELPHRTTIVVPIALKAEFGWLPEDRASASEDLYDRVMGRYTGFGSYTPHEPGDSIMVDATYAKGPLTKLQDSTLVYLYEELDYAMDVEVGFCPDFRQLPAHRLASQLAARIFQRIYVGKELARNETWLKACFVVGMTVGKTGQVLARYPPYLRPLANLFTSEARDFRASMRDIEAFLRPLQEKCIVEIDDFDAIEPSNFIHHYVSVSPSDRKHDTTNLAISLIGLNFAGIMSISFALCEVLLDLAAHNEYVEELREEIATVKRETGVLKLGQGGLGRLHKLDSFIKESLRVNSGSTLSMARKIKKNLLLSNGQMIPAGSYVAVPGSMNDHVELVKDGETGFDGLRWCRKRRDGDGDSKYGWATAGTDTMGFGYGAHACPGRFFATSAVKAVIAEMLMTYDMTLAEGQTRLKPVMGRELRRELDFVSPLLLKSRVTGR